MADYLPKFPSGPAVTFTTTADVTGGRLVIASGVRSVAPATADAATVVGVAAYDTVSGDPVTVFCRPAGVHPLVASGAIAVGAKVNAAAAGKISTIGAGANPIGIALEAATNDGDVIDVLFI